jgi:tetratricopeptide (TPR) repeat protein
VRGRSLGLLAILGCAGAAADHERLGDEHYRGGRYDLALAEYQATQRSTPVPAVWAKLGAAALAVRDGQAAVDAYRQLAEAEAPRAAEAARGLERAARLTGPTGKPDERVGAAALAALRGVAPGRPLGRLAAAGALDGPAPDLVAVMPAAIAAAPPGGAVDELLVRYGAGLRRTTACDAAVRVYRSALRRSREPRLRAEAATGLGHCALRMGLDAMAGDRAELAEQWFAQATAVDSASPVALRARIGWGDARLRQGDVLGAAIAWQAVITAAGAPDSLVRIAVERLNGLANAGQGTGERVP